MLRPALMIAILAGAVAFLVASDPSYAQATRTWVSGVGDDANPCSRTAPCKTFAGAISKTVVNGVIDCIDSGAFGAVTITKSITIDCHEEFAGVLASGTNGIIINVVSTDVLKTVRLRNLRIDGTGSGSRTGLRGVSILSATTVYIEDCVIQNFTQQGIAALSNTALTLLIRNSVIADNVLAGVLVAPANTSTATTATLDNVQTARNGAGVSAAQASGSPAIMVLDNVQIVGNANGIVSNGAAATVFFGGSKVVGNGTAFNSLSSGKITSFENNQVAGNTTTGSAPTTQQLQ